MQPVSYSFEALLRKSKPLKKAIMKSFALNPAAQASMNSGSVVQRNSGIGRQRGEFEIGIAIQRPRKASENRGYSLLNPPSEMPAYEFLNI
jgi:hypothetical protein